MSIEQPPTPKPIFPRPPDPIDAPPPDIKPVPPPDIPGAAAVQPALPERGYESGDLFRTATVPLISASQASATRSSASVCMRRPTSWTEHGSPLAVRRTASRSPDDR